MLMRLMRDKRGPLLESTVKQLFQLLAVNMCFPGHARIVHLLLERNTSGTIPSDSQGATPLHYGAQSNNAVSRRHSHKQLGTCRVSITHVYSKYNIADKEINLFHHACSVSFQCPIN